MLPDENRSPRFYAPPAWTEYAACAQTDPEVFFPDDGVNVSDRVRQICRNCPVRKQCLEFSIANREAYGVWGGMTERERRPIYRRRKATA